MGRYVFERHYDNNDQKNVNLALLIDCHDPSRTVSREPIERLHRPKFCKIILP